MANSNFFKTTMPPTRAADFYLGYLDGAIFMDFNLSKMESIYLKRISFDGYGCCTINNSVSLDQGDSALFVNEMNQEILDQNIVEQLVKKLIFLNQNSIWTDALATYKLL